MLQDSIGVVLDAGSYSTKAGFANEAFPRTVFPTVVGRFRAMDNGLFDGCPVIYCGREAVLKRGLSKMTWPIQEGLITNWDDMEKLWHHVFYKELKVAPEQSRVMHSIHPLASMKNNEKMAEILFETFTVDAIYLMKSPVLALHASGRTSGIVWEAGHLCSYAAPVYEGFPLGHATMGSPLTGELITNRLQKLLTDKGYYFTTAVERDLLNDIKETHCYVAQNYDAELKSMLNSSGSNITHQLPDGQQILLGEERIKCAEVLFKPNLENLTCPSIIDLLNSCIKKCESDYKSLFYDNVVIAGGTSMIPGIVDRLQAELSQHLRSHSLKAKPIGAMASRHYSVWLGGSIMSSIDSFNGFWMTKEEYDDGGTNRVKYKFF